MNEKIAFNNLIFRASTLMLSIVFAFAMIVEIPIWQIALISLVLVIVPLIPSLTTFYVFLYNIVLRPLVYVLALIVTIQGEQDTIAIIFYVVAGLQSFFIIKNFFRFLFVLIEHIFSNKN